MISLVIWDSVDEERVWDYGAVFDTGYPGGLAYCPGPTSAQVPSMWVFSHEVMHNFGSPHNYCGEALPFYGLPIRATLLFTSSI